MKKNILNAFKDIVIEENSYKTLTDFMEQLIHNTQEIIESVQKLKNDKNINELSKIENYALEILSDAEKNKEFLLLEKKELNFKEESIFIDELLNELVEQKKILLKDNVVIDYYINPDIPMLISDSNVLKKVIGNVLDNSIKFTDTGEIFINIDISYEDTQYITLEFNIMDTGIGIPYQLVERIFSEQSYRSGITNGKGLYESKKIIELLSGDICINSQVGNGTTVTLCIDFERACSNSIKNQHDKFKDCEKNLRETIANKYDKIICLKPDGNDTSSIKKYFEHLNVECDFFDFTKAALLEIEKHTKNLVLCDFDRTDYYDILRFLEFSRKNIENDTTIVVVTGYKEKNVIEKIYNNGASLIIHKPISMELLSQLKF